MNDTVGLPPFTPIPARPAQITAAEVHAAETKKPRKKKEVGRFKPGAKEAKPAKKAKAPKKKQAPDLSKRKVVGFTDDGNLREPAKRVRSARVAPLMLDAAVALSALAGLGKTEVMAMRAIIELLNPLARPARKRVLSAVLALMGDK